MNRKIVILAVVAVILIILLGAFFYILSHRKCEKYPTGQNQLVGGDKDEYGCIGSAGYSWCQKKNKCIRTWEEYCTKTAPKKVLFKCDESKTIEASFYVGDDKFVDLILSDERRMSVPRAMSGSGARYAKADESFVFWNKGDTAFITEGTDSIQTFKNCVLSED